MLLIAASLAASVVASLAASTQSLLLLVNQRTIVVASLGFASVRVMSEKLGYFAKIILNF